jgi:5-(carboxyamino)imidazole ribonucleotide synthase
MATIGVLGGGQLGRMMAIDAHTHGHRVIVRTDEPSGGPAAQVADREMVGPYDDQQLNEKFAGLCDGVTVEFENLPVEMLTELARHVPLHPGAFSISICQHRQREKEFLSAHNIPHAPFAVVRSSFELAKSVADFGGEAIAKTAAFGYDGKGQIRFGRDRAANVGAAWDALNTEVVVLEAFVPFVKEISVVGTRSHDGHWVPFAPGENVHVNGVLDYTIAPARISAELALSAQTIAGRIAEALNHVGVIGVEFFVLEDDSLVVNEMAPRPHNSGHHTIEACDTSQFGQQWRATIGEPLGSAKQRDPVVMCNLLGDMWANGEPDWSVIKGRKGTYLHRYGKSEPRAGRKMGHLTVLTTDPEEVLSLRSALRR